MPSELFDLVKAFLEERVSFSVFAVRFGEVAEPLLRGATPETRRSCRLVHDLLQDVADGVLDPADLRKALQLLS